MMDTVMLRCAAGLLFLSAVFELMLLIYKYISIGTHKSCLKEYALFIILLFVLPVITVYAMSEDARLIYPRQLIAVFIISAAVFIYSGIGIFRVYGQNKERLSPASVKQALDNLNSGICFCDAGGRIVLINYEMGRLASELLGGYPQTLNELDHALREIPPKSSVLKLEDGEGLYRFSDGRIWRFSKVELLKDGFEGFTQTVAQEVTELYETNARLISENSELKKTNAKIQTMYDRLSDRIREQETLNLRTRIHNDIGTSLIAISKIMEGGEDKDMDTQVAVLKNAVSYFSKSSSESPKTLDAVRQNAAQMGVELNIYGSIKDHKTEALAAAAAAECVTNCIYHANGSMVNVDIKETDDFYKFTITNDGKIPDGEIKEGGGLGTLRKSVENAAGKMRILHSPVFSLIIDLPKEHRDD